MIAHRNVIANLMQIRWFDEVGRRAQGVETQTVVGLLPMSHIYGLVVVANASIYRGDGVVVLPRFELKTLLESIQKYKINMLHIVRFYPPPRSLFSLNYPPTFTRTWKWDQEPEREEERKEKEKKLTRNPIRYHRS